MRLTHTKQRYLHTLYFGDIYNFIDLVKSMSDDYDKYNIKYNISEIHNLYNLPFKGKEVNWYKEEFELTQITHNWYRVYIFTDCKNLTRFWHYHLDEFKTYIVNLEREFLNV